MLSRNFILWVNLDQEKKQLQYRIYTPDNQCIPGRKERPLVHSVPDLVNYKETFWQNLSNVLNNISPRTPYLDAEKRWENIQIQIRGLGKGIFRRLIPTQLVTNLKELSKSCLIMEIHTNDTWIPWEIMHDGETFLVEKLIVVRIPRYRQNDSENTINNTDSSININYNKDFEKLLKIEKIANVIGGGLDSNQLEKARKLFNDFLSCKNRKNLHQQSISVLGNILREHKIDILHFTCHGELDPPMLQITENTDPINNIAPYTLEDLMPQTDINLVFINACSSNVPSYFLDTFSSFAWKFYDLGVPNVIGTLAEIPIDYAIEFSINFYNILFNEDRIYTVGEAVAEARKIASKRRNVSWLFYSIYGDPDYCFEIIE